MAGRIAVVDNEDRFVRWEQRRTIHERELVHRSVHVLLFDSQGRLIVQQRHRDKQTYALHWDVSACGHVEESDYPAGPDAQLERVYAEVAARELEEELGIVTPLERLAHFAPIPAVHYEQLRLFRGCSDAELRLQAEEVEDAGPRTRAQLLAMRDDPQVLLTSSLRYFMTWLDERELWPAQA